MINTKVSNSHIFISLDYKDFHDDLLKEYVGYDNGFKDLDGHKHRTKRPTAATK
jgi:hypothetical protein